MAKDLVIGGVKYTTTTSKTPYTDIAKAYAKDQKASYKSQKKAMKKQLVKSKASTNANFDSNASQAYINHARQQNALPEQLQAQGINGGASETAMVQMGNQYALNQSNNNAARSAAIADLQNTYATNVANLKQQTLDNIAANNLAMAQQQAQYSDTLRQRKLEQYQATIERFTSEDQIDRAIKKLNKKDPNYVAYKQLLQWRKAQIQEAKKNASSGGGGGGYGGGGYGGSGYGSGSSSSGYTTPANAGYAGNTRAAYEQRFGSGSTSTTSTTSNKGYAGNTRDAYESRRGNKSSKSTRGGSSYSRHISRGGIW